MVGAGEAVFSVAGLNSQIPEVVEKIVIVGSRQRFQLIHIP